MSVQIALLAPATRIASRKLGPIGGQALALASPPIRPAAWAASRLASTCGRCETQAISRSWVSASIAVGMGAEAPQQRVQALVEHARGAPRAGVRYQVAPSKRSSRACSTPAVSAPASGCPPTKRSSAAAAASSRLVEPTSLTTQSAAAAASASATVAAQRRRRGRDEHRLGAGDRLREVARRLDRSRPARAPARGRAGRGRSRDTSASARARAARPIEPPISPTPRTAIRIRSARRRLRRGGVASADGLREALEHLDGRLPADAPVGDRLAVAQLAVRAQVLAARRAGTTPASRRRSRGSRPRSGRPRRLPPRLALGVLGAVVVAQVDHHASRQPGGLEQLERRPTLAARSWAGPCLRAG